MPEIPLLEPLVLQGVVRRLQTPENLVLTSRVPRTPVPTSTVSWDIEKGSRLVGRPNYPNSEAHIVPRLGRSQASASLVYYREKKIFSPTTMMWLRAPGTISNIERAEELVLREVTDLNQRLDNFVEYCLWSALSTGTLNFNYEDVVASVNYQMPSSHTVHPAVSWDTATPAQIISDVQAWKRLMSRDSRVNVTEAWATEYTLTKILAAFARASATLMTDRMRDAYYSDGIIPGFMGLQWNTVEAQYDADNGSTALFLPDNALILTNLTDNRPIELFEGPSADRAAGQGYIGKFSKTWEEEDPSGYNYLLEYHFLPVIKRPEQIITIPNLTQTS